MNGICREATKDSNVEALLAFSSYVIMSLYGSAKIQSAVGKRTSWLDTVAQQLAHLLSQELWVCSCALDAVLNTGSGKRFSLYRPIDLLRSVEESLRCYMMVFSMDDVYYQFGERMVV